MNLTLHLVLCGILLVITVCVGVYRKWLEDHCDHYIHLHNDAHDAAVVHTQEALCHRLEMMSRLQTGLITATIAYAVIIVALASYLAWRNAGGA